MQETVAKYVASHAGVSKSDVSSVPGTTKIRLSHAFVRSRFFDPVCLPAANHLRTLLLAELSSGGIPTDFVITAGGFAESQVFAARVEAAVEEAQAAGHPVVRVIKAKEPVMAIVRGAGLFGMLHGIVHERCVEGTREGSGGRGGGGGSLHLCHACCRSIIPFNYGIVFSRKASEWSGGDGSIPEYCSTFESNGELFVEYVFPLALAGTAVQLNESRISRGKPLELHQSEVASDIVRTSYPLRLDDESVCMLRRSEAPLSEDEPYDPRGVHFADVHGSLISEVGQEGSLEDRVVLQNISFSGTEIKVTAYVAKTHHAVEAAFKFGEGAHVIPPTARRDCFVYLDDSGSMGWRPVRLQQGHKVLGYVLPLLSEVGPLRIVKFGSKQAVLFPEDGVEHASVDTAALTPLVSKIQEVRRLPRLGEVRR